MFPPPSTFARTDSYPVLSISVLFLSPTAARSLASIQTSLICRVPSANLLNLEVPNFESTTKVTSGGLGFVNTWSMLCSLGALRSVMRRCLGVPPYSITPTICAKIDKCSRSLTFWMFSTFSEPPSARAGT